MRISKTLLAAVAAATVTGQLYISKAFDKYRYPHGSSDTLLVDFDAAQRPLGRISLASGKVPAAIHMSPEASAGGAIGNIQEGDMTRLNATVGTLNVMVDEDVCNQRTAEIMTKEQKLSNRHGIGRELFGNMRKNVLSAEEGAITWMN